VVCRILQRGGFEALIANDGRHAIVLESDFEGKIDLLLSDVMMPIFPALIWRRNSNYQAPDARDSYVRVPWRRASGFELWMVFHPKAFSPLGFVKQDQRRLIR
jgi:CheY-like chemotaxis protein